MIVDPATGLPIELSSTAQNMAGNYDPSAVSGAIGIDMATQAGITSPAVLGMLEHIPSAWATMGWNAGRGANTILRGGYNPDRPGRMGLGSSFRQGVAGFNRRGWTRFASAENIDPLPTSPGRKGIYTPFNFMASAGNKLIGTYVDRTFKALEGPDIPARAAMRMQALRDNAIIPRGTPPGKHHEYISRGTLSRISAASKLYRAGNVPATASQMANVSSFINKTNPRLANAFNGHRIASGMTGGGVYTAQDMADLTLGSARGTVSQYVGGYMRGGRLGAIATDSASGSILKSGGSEAVIRGSSKAAAHLGLGDISFVGGRLTHASGAVGRRALTAGMRTAFIKGGAGRAGAMAAAKVGLAGGAGYASLAVPGLNVVMAAWMAYDLASMGISAMTGAADFVKDAGKSLKGTIDKPVMGMGYKDNTVAATSRARGVQAIANSRLNARSVLGSEGAMLAAHFG